MSLSPQSTRLLCLIAALSSARNVCADIKTLAARTSLDIEAVRTEVGALVAVGLVSREMGGTAPAATAGVECRLTFAGWDIVDDLAAVDPRADLDAKQREYSAATAAISRFTDFSGPPTPGSAPVAADFADAVEAEELAKHRYDRALARFLAQQHQPVAAR
jgi:hypothetical protein